MDLDPELVHPIHKKSIREMLASCNLEGIEKIA
jgi:hypothetical protein